MTDFGAHTRGESPYIDDLPEPKGLLHAAVYASPVAHGRLLAIDTSAADDHPGVVYVLTAKDIPGANEIGGIIQDEPLLADGDLHFLGQPVAVVVASDRVTARRAAALIRTKIEELPGVFEPREAASRGDLIAPSRTLEFGDVAAAWARCHTVVRGTAASGGQEHIYLETQGAMALPSDGGKLKILSATQAPTAVQRIAGRVLDLPMNAIEVEVNRLGGAFGGKEDQATPWAVISALAATILGKPVKIVLGRQEDIRWTGKRHPYSSDFTIGVDADGKILAYEATFFQNAGAAADLSTAILERSLFHATNSYFIPNVRVTGHSCRTNLPPFTAFRGFGAPQAIFVLESAIRAAAEKLGSEPNELQRRNLLSDGDLFPYGMAVENPQARRSFADATSRYDLDAMRSEVDRFNSEHRLSKRGLATQPVCFGISFTNSFLNQAGALVHVYTDGSVAVSTGAVEMGQGVNAKIQRIAELSLGVPSERISVHSTSTDRVANTSPTAASSGADMNGAATRLACRSLVDRLLAVAADELSCASEELGLSDGVVSRAGIATKLVWNQLVWTAYTRRVNLTAQAHYATPRIHYDKQSETGRPFAYHVFGTAIVQVTVDCLRGVHTVDRVSIVHDAGKSLNQVIDRGQVDGGLVQGIGWMTMEELAYDNGRITSDSLSTYKVPDIHAAPEIDCVFLEDVGEPAAVLTSKAVGEPPFMYGIGVYFALLDAMRAFRPAKEGFFDAPMTPEKVLRFLYE